LIIKSLPSPISLILHPLEHGEEDQGSPEDGDEEDRRYRCPSSHFFKAPLMDSGGRKMFFQCGRKCSKYFSMGVNVM